MQSSKSTAALKILAVSPIEEDHLGLQAIVSHSSWMLFQANRIPTAVAILGLHEIPVLLCERGLMWDVLRTLHDVPHPPCVIVTSRCADERLWAEALNAGAWDVLQIPFEATEVIRSVKAAWQHWHHLYGGTARFMKAAG